MCPRIWIGAVLVAVTLAVFGSVIDHEFVAWDDDINVYENPKFHPPTVQHTIDFWKNAYQHLYIPLTYTLWSAAAAGSRGSPPDPRLFHALNLVFHVLSTLIVFSILRILLGRNAGRDDGGERFANILRIDWAAGIGALVFSLHPVQVEPVAWVTGMKDVLCGCLSLAAIREYLVDAREPRDPAMGWRRRQYGIATIFLVLALLAKPTAVVVPVIVWILNRALLGRSWRESLDGLIGWSALAIGWIFLTTHVQPESNMNVVAPIWARPLLAGDAASFYLHKLFVPVPLAPDYGRTATTVLQMRWFYLVWPIPYAAAGLIWSWRNRPPWLASSFGVFIAGILPVLGLIPFDYQRYSTVADRYLYLSMLGPALAVALAASSRRNRIWMVTGLVLVSLLGMGSAFQTRLWYDTQTIFEHTLTVNPNSYVSHNNIGRVQIAEEKYDSAIGHLAAALRIKPGDEIIHNNLGLALAATGKLDEAVGHYEESLRINPDYDSAHNNLGVALARLGRMAEATAHFEAALKISPDRPEIIMNLRRARDQQKKIQHE